MNTHEKELRDIRVETTRLSTLKDVQKLMDQSSSEDGESLTFEAKGSSGEVKFTKDTKNNLAKEICAFTNTYGGLLCYHYGEGNIIEGFPDNVAKEQFSSIETWLRDSLEPKLLGINLEIVEGMFLIHIPESKIKPHRTNTKAEYVYRHSTISQRMPEIMVSSMYRSQEYLSFSLSVAINKIGKQFDVSVSAKNHSNLSGTKPKIQIQLFSGIRKLIRFQESRNFDIFSQDSFHVSSLMSKLRIPRCVMLSTSTSFSEKILYPQDSILLSHYSEEDDKIPSLKYILSRVDCMFRESIRETFYSLTEFDEESKPLILMSTKGYSNAEIILKFNYLTKNMA